MKNFIKNLLNKSSLYRAELTVICTILLCFAISGICLPAVKGQIPSEEPVKEQTALALPKEESKSSKSKDESVKTEKSADVKKEEKKKEHEKDKDKDKEEKKTPENTQVAADEPQQDSSASAVPQNPAADNPGNISSGNTSSDSSVPAPPAPPQTTPEPEKVWVPPVYTTVHHEAVYDTIQMVCCNYCGATFGSVGEFQVHKDANGG